MSSVRFRIDEGETPQPTLLWDSIWQPSLGIADWAIADFGELQNRGGLRAKAALHSAIVIALFTDKRCPPDHPLAYLVEGDPRGWFGDGIDIVQDLGERELGSLLWILERAPLTEQIRRHAEAAAYESLYPLISQGVVASITVEAVMYPALDRMDLGVNVYGSDGKVMYDLKFAPLWQQTATAPKPLPFPDFGGPVRPPVVVPPGTAALRFNAKQNSMYLGTGLGGM